MSGRLESARQILGVAVTLLVVAAVGVSILSGVRLARASASNCRLLSTADAARSRARRTWSTASRRACQAALLASASLWAWRAATSSDAGGKRFMPRLSPPCLTSRVKGRYPRVE